MIGKKTNAKDVYTLNHSNTVSLHIRNGKKLRISRKCLQRITNLLSQSENAVQERLLQYLVVPVAHCASSVRDKGQTLLTDIQVVDEFVQRNYTAVEPIQGPD